MKRTITVLLVACVLIFSSLTVASASMSDIIAPMADNYRSVYADLKITSGEATVSAKMNGKIGITTKVTIHLYLQQYKDGKWVDYDDWTPYPYPKAIPIAQKPLATHMQEAKANM